ncbi:Structural maintenance of chromosomes protein 6 [Cadophora gregata]|uniref:Structural maintenance of chromosomes protein 6 n=1 Tax=Cadophora gregata TaxID=51156 RepID=UPI0026DB9CEE|nr:Structural maintenance of chromosomes protein 6 [Cadophora gregata]KAK0101479.1 Structural maintenance of chromosomes protein 6 [Cadophora gregata]
MAPQKRARTENDEEITSVESASSALRQDGSNKKARLSNTSKPRDAPSRSPSPSSSDDDSDDELLAADDAPALPASTQYETQRDNGFIHLNNTKADDAKERKRFMAKKMGTKTGDNRAADNAIIQKITCRNFMCHDNLVVPLGPLINFVVGMNGSGKSAVLTAITLCLGGKTAATNRGASLKALIKSGREQASLIIELKNEGIDAYQPDLYGKKIIIERHFSRSGSSSFKLKTELNKLISTKKGDVEDIVEYYQLQVDNPMNVLTQDAAKSFITASTPAMKYKFFVEGVQLEALDRDYKIISDTCDQIETRLHDSKGDLNALKKRTDAAIQRAETVRKYDGVKIELKRLRKKLAWVQVAEQEKILADLDQKVADSQQQIVDAQRNAEVRGAALDGIDEAIQRTKEVETRLEEERGPVTEEEDAARHAHEEASKEVAKFHIQQKSVVAALKDAKDMVKGIKAEITAEQARLHAAHGGAQDKKIEELAVAQQAAEDARTNLSQNEEDKPRLEEHLKEAQAEMSKLESPLRAKTEELKSAKARLSSLGSNRGDRMAGFDKNMPTLLRAIQADRAFREKPIGPLGLHIQLLQPKWSNVIESTLGNALNGFIVTSKADSLRLKDHLKRQKMMFCPVSIGNFQPLDTTNHEPDPQYDTILRVLNINNEAVKRQLIIGHAIEQTLLVASRTEAIRIMYEGPRPRNVKNCFAMHDSRPDWGHRVALVGGGGRDISPVYPPRGRARMQTDTDSQINLQKETVQSLDAELKARTQVYERQKGEVSKCKDAIQQNKRDNQQLKVASQRAAHRVDSLQSEIDNLQGDDGKLDGLKQDLEPAEEGLRLQEKNYGDSVLEKNSLNAAATEKKRALDAIKERLVEFDTKMQKIQNKIRNQEQARKLELTQKNRALEEVEMYQEKKEEAERRVATQNETVAEFTKDAMKICARVTLEPGDTETGLGRIYETKKKQLEDARRRQGGTDEEIQQEAIDAKAIFSAAVSNRKELEELLQLLKQSFMLRLQQYRAFQKWISARSRINFSYLLSERAFRGTLVIDHANKLLDVVVQPDDTNKSSKGRQTKTLSGGEKSFSSICLLLSLWEAMGAPLRCLDEFDVFMDDVNRDVSTRMIISAARKSVGRQFILITPKALGAGMDADADVNMIKLTDPREKQKKIDEMLR